MSITGPRLYPLVLMLMVIPPIANACTIYPTALPAGSPEPLLELTSCEPVSCWRGQAVEMLTYEDLTSLVASVPGFENVEGHQRWKKDGGVGYAWVASTGSQVVVATLDGYFVSLLRWFESVPLERAVEYFGPPTHVFAYPTGYPYPNSAEVWLMYESKGIILFSDPVLPYMKEIQILPHLGIRGYSLGRKPELTLLLQDLAIHAWAASPYPEETPGKVAASMAPDAQLWEGYGVYTVTWRSSARDYIIVHP